MTSSPEVPPLLRILHEACQKYGYTWRVVDAFSNSLVEVSDGQKTFVASNGKTGAYPINPHFAAGLVNDKAWTGSLLQQKGFRTIPGDYFFLIDEHQDLRGEGKEIKDAMLYAQKIGYPVFVKPNRGSLGVMAEVVHDEAQLRAHLDLITERTYIALIQEVISLPEYRLFVLDGEVQFAYRRESPKIVGDGESTVKVLIDGLNDHIKRERNYITETSPTLQRQLKQQDLTMDSVLSPGQTLVVASKNNLGAGGTIEDYRETVSPQVQDWARALTEAFNLRVCGIDVFVENNDFNAPENFLVIELNHNPNLTGIHTLGHPEKALGIWRKVLERYFGA